MIERKTKISTQAIFSRRSSNIKFGKLVEQTRARLAIKMSIVSYLTSMDPLSHRQLQWVLKYSSVKSTNTT